MSLSLEQLEEHCKIILKSRRIKNKIVVLCEGDIPKIQGRLSPHSYGQMETMPDANFYQACVPKSWMNYRPQFFNCGDRKDVIDTYFKLLKIHDSNSSGSYLKPQKLFAMVDLDIQLHKIADNYSFSDTEAIFYDLYDQSRVNEKNAVNHFIWVTGLIHKEAYFLIPELQEVFDNFRVNRVNPHYKGTPIVLQNIYNDMADDIINDADLKNHLKTAATRINYCPGLDCTDLQKLGDSWKHQFKNAADVMQTNELILALLTIKKAKSYWHQIQPKEGDWTGSYEVFRDQLILEIGQFYSKQSEQINYTQYHIPCFFKILQSYYEQ